MEKLNWKFEIILALMFLCAIKVYSQAHCYKSWSIESDFLINGSLGLKPGQVKDIKFTVTAFRSFDGAGFEDVDFKFELTRLRKGENDFLEGYSLTQVLEVTSEDFPDNMSETTKEFTISVSADNSDSSPETNKLKDGDYILLVIHDASLPNNGINPVDERVPVIVSSTLPTIPAPPPSTPGTIYFQGNNICCVQYVVQGETPDKLIQDPRVTLNLTNVTSISWDYCVSSYINPGTPPDNGGIECTPTPTQKQVRYQRILHTADGCQHISNWVTLYPSALTPSLTFSNNDYSNYIINQAYRVYINGTQTVTSPNLSVDFVAGKIIVLSPGAHILPDIHLYVDPTIVRTSQGAFYNDCSALQEGTCAGGRLATDSVNIDNNDKQNLQTNKLDEDFGLTLTTYPNPASKEITVMYSVPRAQMIMIYLVDNLGRSIATLTDDEFPEIGIHKKTLPVSQLPAGIYFIQMNSSEKTLIKKIIISNVADKF